MERSQVMQQFGVKPNDEVFYKQLNIINNWQLLTLVRSYLIFHSGKVKTSTFEQLNGSTAESRYNLLSSSFKQAISTYG